MTQQAWARSNMPRYGLLSYDTTPRHGEEGPRYGQPASRGVRYSARAGPGWWKSRYKVVLWLGGGLVGRDTARGLATGLYRETGATRRRERHDWALEARDTAPCATIRSSAPCDTTQGCCNTRGNARKRA